MRVSISISLTLREIPQVFVHELLHVEQIFTQRLSMTSNGRYLWGGNQYLTNTPYERQPWEQDVAQKQQKTLEKILKISLDNK